MTPDMAIAVVAPVVAPVVAAGGDVDLTAVALKIVNAVQSGNWRVVAALVLIACVAFVRWVAPKVHGAFGAWLNSDRGGATLVIVGGATGAAGTAMMAGQKVSLSLIITGLTTGLMAAGGWNVFRKIFSPNDKPAKAAPPGAAGVVPPAAVAILLIGLMSIAGCGFCSVAANKDTARCKAQFVATDCAAPEVIKIVSDIMGSVSAALASNDYSKLLDAIVADVTKAGRADGLGVVLCAITKVGNQPMASEKISAVVSHANAYKAAHPVKAGK